MTSTAGLEPSEKTLTEGGELLGDITDWYQRFIRTAQPVDLCLLTLWTAHTHLAEESGTTPRLLIDSPVPGSGKTTVLEHLGKLCQNPVQAASISSVALFSRIAAQRPHRTILIDEADRSLDPKRPGVEDLLAILNSGYKKGGSRPTLMPDKEEGWREKELPTYAPVAMAGNSPNLPNDTRSRCIRLLLLPDRNGEVEDSDWEEIEDEAYELHARLVAWANSVRSLVPTIRPQHEGLRARDKERWRPLLRVALATGDKKWESLCRDLINRDLQQQQLEREAGLEKKQRHVMLLTDIAQMWDEGSDFMPTTDLLEKLHVHYSIRWGEKSSYGSLTAQGLGRSLSSHFNIRSIRQTNGGRERGYNKEPFISAWSALGIPIPQ